MLENEFKEWLRVVKDDGGTRHALSFIEEDPGTRCFKMEAILELARSHYESEGVVSARLKMLGATKTAELLRKKLPTTKQARSGEMGEMLATEIAERLFDWRVPVRRLRWKDGREMALRGDDLTGIWEDEKGRLWFLKGESKSRAGSIASAISDARQALDRDRGRPTALSVIFVSERLHEAEECELALKMDEAVSNSFHGSTVEHLLFTMTGTDPEPQLSAHFHSIQSKKRKQTLVGLQIRDHAEFIKQIYDAL